MKAEKDLRRLLADYETLAQQEWSRAWRPYDRQAQEQTGISAQTIQKRVKQALNANPQEREIFMKQKIIKVAVSVLALFSISAGGVLAATQLDFFQEFFVDDTAKVEEKAYLPEKSVMTGGGLQVTLEKVLSDQENAIIIYSIEALNEAGQAWMQQETFQHQMDNDVYITREPGSEIGFVSATSGEYEEYREENKRYYFYEVSGIDNPKAESLWLCIRTSQERTECPRLEIPIQNHLPVYDLTIDEDITLFNGQPFHVDSVHITALSVDVKGTVPEAVSEIYRDGVFFYLKDGSIKTCGQMVDEGTFAGGQEIDERTGAGKITWSGRFKAFAAAEDLAGVIINDKLYTLDGKTKGKAMPVDEKLYTFLLKPVVQPDAAEGYDLLRMPLKKLTDALGATLTWDEAAQTATVQYRGNEAVFQVGSSTAQKNGKTVQTPDDYPTQIWQGQLLVSGDLAEEALDIIIADRTNYMTEGLEDDEWVILP